MRVRRHLKAVEADPLQGDPTIDDVLADLYIWLDGPRGESAVPKMSVIPKFASVQADTKYGTLPFLVADAIKSVLGACFPPQGSGKKNDLAALRHLCRVEGDGKLSDRQKVAAECVTIRPDKSNEHYESGDSLRKGKRYKPLIREGARLILQYEQDFIGSVSEVLAESEVVAADVAGFSDSSDQTPLNREPAPWVTDASRVIRSASYRAKKQLIVGLIEPWHTGRLALDHDEDIRSLWGAASLMHYYLTDAVLPDAEEEPKRAWVDGWGSAVTVDVSGRESGMTIINYYETRLATGQAPSRRRFFIPPFTVGEVAQLASAAATHTFLESASIEVFKERLARLPESARVLWREWLKMCSCPISDLKRALEAHEGGPFAAVSSTCPVHFNLFGDSSIHRLDKIEPPTEVEVIRRLQQVWTMHLPME